jgi:hypothetical protein
MLHPTEQISIAKLGRVVGMSESTLDMWARRYGMPHKRVHPRLRETTLRDFCAWLRLNRSYMHANHLPKDVRSRLMSLADSFGGAA